MNFADVEAGVRGIQTGLCDGFYAMNTGMLNGFAGVSNAICNLGYETQQNFNTTGMSLVQGQHALQTQLADCCCDLKSGLSDISYRMATDTCAIQNTINGTARDIIDSTNAGFRSIMQYLNDKETADLREQVNSLKLAASQQAQNNYLVSQLGPKFPTPAYTVPNPFVPYGFGGCANAYSACAC